MTQPPSAETRKELEAAIARDPKVLGAVYPLLQEGLNDSEIARKLGKNTSGFVANNRAIIRAALDGVMPRGSAISHQVASALRRVAATPDLSADARDHLTAVIRQLDGSEASPDSKPTSRHTQRPTSSHSTGSLRDQVDAEIRVRVRDLVQRVEDEARLDADDYYRALSGSFALDQIVDLVSRNLPCKTSTALRDARRYDLTIEQAVVDWSSDLPLAADLVEMCRGRLGFWRKP